MKIDWKKLALSPGYKSLNARIAATLGNGKG